MFSFAGRIKFRFSHGLVGRQIAKLGRGLTEDPIKSLLVARARGAKGESSSFLPGPDRFVASPARAEKLVRTFSHRVLGSEDKVLLSVDHKHCPRARLSVSS